MTLTKNNKNSVLNKGNATNIGKSKIIYFEWYVPHYTPSISQQAILSKQILSKSRTEPHYIERSFFMKELKN